MPTPSSYPGSLQVVYALRPQCIILPDFQHGGRLLQCERFFFFFEQFMVFTSFAHLFYAKMLYLESLKVANTDFGIEVFTLSW